MVRGLAIFDAFVDNTRIKDGIYLLVNQGLDVTVNQLSRVADCIRWDGLTFSNKVLSDLGEICTRKPRSVRIVCQSDSFHTCSAHVEYQLCHELRHVLISF